MSEQPLALGLADELAHGYPLAEYSQAAAAELRRLHLLNAELLEALRAYLPPDGITKDEFISRVVALADPGTARVKAERNQDLGSAS